MSGGWNRDQVKDFARRVRERTGSLRPDGAWTWLPYVREALVAECVLDIVLGQERREVEVEEVRKLLLALRRELGLDDDGGIPSEEAE